MASKEACYGVFVDGNLLQVSDFLYVAPLTFHLIKLCKLSRDFQFVSY